MSQPLATQLLTVGLEYNINIPNQQTTSALKVSNKSPYDVVYAGYGVIGSSIIPSGVEYFLYGDIYNSGSLNLTAINTTNVTPANPGAVLVVQYFTGELLPKGSWPVSIPFQTVNTSSSVTSTTELLNVGSTPPTTVIQVQPSDATGTNYTIFADNTGQFYIQTDNGGVLTQLFKITSGASPTMVIGAATVPVQVLEQLNVNAMFDVTGTTGWAAITGTAGTMNLRIQSGNQINFQVPGGTTLWQISSSGDLSCIGGGAINFNVGRIKDFNSGNVTTAGTVTVNHGLSGTPNAVIVTPSSSGSSATFSANTYTSTQFTLFNGSGTSQNFHWIAYR